MTQRICPLEVLMTERYNYIDSNKAHEMRCVHALIIMVLGAAEIIHDQFFD